MHWQEQIERFEALGIAPKVLVRFNQRFRLDETDFENLYQTCTHLGALHLAVANEWELLCLLGNIDLLERHVKEIIKINGNWGEKAVHYLALSGSLSVLKWMSQVESIFSLKFVLASSIKSKDDRGRTILHFVAASGSIPAIQYVLKTYPELVDTKTDSGANFILYTALTGSVKAIQYVLEVYPELKDSKTNQGLNLLHYAVYSGSVEAIEFVLETYPELKDMKNESGRNLLHCAGMSGSIPAIEFVLEKYPNLHEDSLNDMGDNVLHLISKEGYIKGIQFILHKYPDLKDSINIHGANFLHKAALSGSVQAIEYILQRYPELRDTKDAGGANLLFYTAGSDSVSAVKYLLHKYPMFQYTTDKQKSNLLHYAAYSSEEIIACIFEHNPGRISELLVSNIFGQTPDILRLKYGITKSVTQILKELIFKKLQTIVSAGIRIDIISATQFIQAINGKVVEYLLSDDFSDKDLLDRILKSNLPETLLYGVDLRFNLELKAFSLEMSDKPLTKDSLKRIVTFIEEKEKSEKNPPPPTMFSRVFNAPPVAAKEYSAFCMNLQDFLKYCSESLDLEEEIITLKTIIDDYKRDALLARNSFLTHIVNILENVNQVKLLRHILPQRAIFTELMQYYVKEYESTQKTMRGLQAKLTSTIRDAADFILDRHRYTPYLITDDYAQTGKVCRNEVQKYLKEVLGYKEKIECTSDENRFYYFLFAAKKAAQEYIDYHKMHARPLHGGEGIARAYRILYCTKIEELIPLLEESAKNGGNFPHSLNTFLQSHLIEFLPENQKNNLPFFAYSRMEVIISAVKASQPVNENNTRRNTPRP